MGLTSIMGIQTQMANTEGRTMSEKMEQLDLLLDTLAISTVVHISDANEITKISITCLLYTSPSPRDS